MGQKLGKRASYAMDGGRRTPRQSGPKDDEAAYDELIGGHSHHVSDSHTRSSRVHLQDNPTSPAPASNSMSSRLTSPAPASPRVTIVEDPGPPDPAVFTDAFVRLSSSAYRERLAPHHLAAFNQLSMMHTLAEELPVYARDRIYNRYSTHTLAWLCASSNCKVS